MQSYLVIQRKNCDRRLKLKANHFDSSHIYLHQRNEVHRRAINDTFQAVRCIISSQINPALNVFLCNGNQLFTRCNAH